MSVDGPVTVLYIAGAGRSGSTLLDRVLGQVDGFFGAGELRYLWQRGVQQDRLCGCGLRFGDCKFWREVLDEAVGGAANVGRAAAAAARAAGRTARVRHLPQLLRAGTGPGSAPAIAGAEEYADLLGRLYRAVGKVAGCDVVIDSSKLPSYARLLADVPTIELWVVHLVRDPRATAYSWMRAKALPDRAGQSHMERRSAIKSALLWDVWNGATLAFFGDGPRRLLLRYEDLAANPRQAVASVLDLMGRGGAQPPFIDERTVVLGPSHSVAGNPDRLTTGPVEIREDSAWVSALSPGARWAVTATTAPLLRRFGYRLIVPKPKPAPARG